MDETIEVNLLKDKKISDSKNLPWPQKYEDFIKDIKEKFKLKKNTNIILTLITIDEDDWDIGSQDDLDPYLEEDKIKKFNIEITEEPEPEPDLSNPPLNPEPQVDILEINIDEIIKEVFNNDAYKKELEINNKQLSDNFKSNLELSINSIIEERQKVLVNDIDSKLKLFVDDFSKNQKENKDLVVVMKDEINDIKDHINEMSSAILDFKNNFDNFKKNFKPEPKPIPIKMIKFEQKKIERIIEMKAAKFININNINIINAGNVSFKNLCFIKEQENSSNDLRFFSNSKETNEYEISMQGELKPKDSLPCAITMNINNPQAGQEYKIIINVKENDEIVSDSFEIIIKINKPKEEEDPRKQKEIQANKAFEEIKNQFPNHENLINKNDIINKLIENNINKDEIINDIKNQIKKIEEDEKNARVEQLYSELNLSNSNINKNEIIDIIKEKNFDKEEIQKWIDAKVQAQNRENAQNLYNNLRNDQNLDFSKCPNEEAILNKIIELRFNEGEIRNFFEKKGGEEDPKVIEIFNDLENDYGITSFKEKEEVIDKIKELNCDKEKINKWVEDIVVNGA